MATARLLIQLSNNINLRIHVQISAVTYILSTCESLQAETVEAPPDFDSACNRVNVFLQTMLPRWYCICGMLAESIVNAQLLGSYTAC